MAGSFQEALKQAGLAGASSPTPESPASFQDALQQAGLDTTMSGIKAPDGEFRPLYANGTSPFTPINESPLSAIDRAKLALGDEKGNLEWLKSRYGAVSRNKNGDYTVKDKDGLWKRVDPEGNAGDPWEFTKDIADAVPTLGKIALGVGAAAATGGASLGVQAAAAAGAGALGSGLETSMGRAVGTYAGDTTSQLADAGIEALFNTAGVFIAPGAKWAASKLAPALKSVGTTIAKMAPEDSAAAKMLLKVTTGATDDVSEMLIKETDAVTGRISELASKKITGDTAKDYLKDQGVTRLRYVMDDLDDAVSETYEQGLKSVANSYDATVKPSLGFLKQNMETLLESSGLGTKDKAGNFGLKSVKQIWKDLESSGNLPESLGLNKAETLGLIRKVYGEVTQVSKANLGTGPQAMKKLITLDKNLKLLTKQLRGVADKTQNSGLTGFANNLAVILDDAVKPNFVLKSPVKTGTLLRNAPDEALTRFKLPTETLNPYETLNTFYRTSQDSFGQISSMVKTPGQGKAAVETLYNNLTSAGGRNAAKKSGFESMVDLVTSQGGQRATRIQNNLYSMAVDKAASHFSQNLRPGLISSIAGVGAVTSALSGNTEAAGVMGLGALVTSPKLAAAVTKNLLKSKGFLSTLKPTQLTEFRQTPGMFSKMVRSAIESPLSQQALTQSLVTEGANQITGRGGR